MKLPLSTRISIGIRLTENRVIITYRNCGKIQKTDTHFMVTEDAAREFACSVAKMLKDDGYVVCIDGFSFTDVRTYARVMADNM